MCSSRGRKLQVGDPPPVSLVTMKDIIGAGNNPGRRVRQDVWFGVEGRVHHAGVGLRWGQRGSSEDLAEERGLRPRMPDPAQRSLEGQGSVSCVLLLWVLLLWTLL